MYHLIDIESATPILDDSGNVRVFDTVQDAVLTMQGLFAITGKKYKPKQIIDSSWHDREANKFANGEYKRPYWLDLFYHERKVKDEYTGKEKLEWHWGYSEYDYSYASNVTRYNVKIEVNPHHFLHVSKLDRTKIAFTESDDKGMNDRQTQMNVSRYLSQYCGIDNELAKYVNSLHEKEYKEHEIFFESDGQKIVELYQKSPSSCMTKEESYYDSFCHPMLVYGNSDISMAYMLNGDDRVKARVMVWQEKKIYSRFYGDYESLRKALNDKGYTSDDNFHGAKLNRIYDDNEERLVLPYLDGCQTVTDKGSYLMIDDCGDILADTTNGLARKQRYATCDSCEEDILDSDDANTVYLGSHRTRTYCNYCRDEYTIVCESTGDNIHRDNVTCIDGLYYADWIAEEANYCDRSEEYTFNDTIEVYTNETDNEFWNNRYEDETFVCRIDGRRYCNGVKANDSWNDEPRAIFNIPNDKPDNCNDRIAYRCFSHDQLELVVYRNYETNESELRPNHRQYN